MAAIPLPDRAATVRAYRRLRDRLIELAETEQRLGQLHLRSRDTALARRSFRIAKSATHAAGQLHRLVVGSPRPPAAASDPDAGTTDGSAEPPSP